MSMFVMCHFGLLLAAFLLHVVAFRKVIRTERAIFLFNLLLFVILPQATFLLMSSFDFSPSIYDVMAAYGLSGIYALSFLEMWSLTQGSYSLQVLVWMHESGSVSAEVLDDSEGIHRFQDIGAQKQDDRLQALLQLKLIDLQGVNYKLTPMGRTVAIAAHLISRLAGVKLGE